ncbi:MAG: hypothetical protein Ct9H90mP13_07500 [Pseudomonadota bacterium]|nr:MAG: hypothetical protein Ct9H90mP13_07500 [Pseudomonadota bacterium]
MLHGNGEDAYNASGRNVQHKVFFCHNNWSEHLIPKNPELANRRNLDNLTVGPVLTWEMFK